MAASPGTTWTIVVAAGSGSRFGGTTAKQFVEVAGRRLVDWAVEAAAAVSDGIVVVTPADVAVTVSSRAGFPEVRCVEGGATRSESVRRGLAEVPSDAGTVLVHDAARPVASPDLFRRVAEALAAGAAAVVPVVDVVDTIRSVDGSPVDRASLQAVQTPQGFSAELLRRAHAGADDATDDATLVRVVGGPVVTVAGERWNIKVTEPDDEVVVAALLAGRS